jgi:threonine aldolase
MNFASDNWAGAHPAIGAALLSHGKGVSAAYQTGEIDRAVERQFCDLFERDVAVFFVPTGTAANALALTAAARPGGVAFCHADAHIAADECGAVEYLAGGLRLAHLRGEAGRIDPAALRESIAHYPAGSVHSGQPVAVSITQSTELGTVYSPDAVGAIGDICRAHGLAFHMDGARFANALVRLGTTPAEMTWKRGVDMLSFGATKNGCWCAETLVFFNPEMAAQMPFIRKRAGHLFSKSRFVAAQLQAYLANDLWLANARHANRMAGELADVLRKAGARLPWPVEANSVFPVLKKAVAARLREAGATFHEWQAGQDVAPDVALYRFVTSYATERAEIDRLAALLA